MARLTVAFLALLALGRDARAALDPESEKPYHLQVVLLLGEHRVFTPVFREQVEREVRDNLQTALGNLARVTVVKDHPLSEEIRSKGLLKVLDSVRLVSDTKIHFVVLDFANGQYELQTRQYDGATGTASANVRQMQISDRQLVGRTAALLVEQDLGLVGTLRQTAADPPQGEKVTLALKGGRLGVPLDRWVKKDEVFAVAQIRAGAAGPRAALVQGAYLQVVEAPRDGACTCLLWYRFSPALPGGPDVLGFRALKLATAESRLRLRVVPSENSREPLHALQVTLSRDGAAGAKDDAHVTNLNEPIQSRQKYRHLAFATIDRQGVRLAGPFPLPVLGDAPQTVSVGVAAEAERRGPLVSRVRTLARGVSDSLLTHAGLVTDFNRTSEKTPEAALKSGRAGLGQMRSDLLHQENELRALRVEAGKLGVNLQKELGELAQRLKELGEGQRRFESHLNELDKVLTQLKDPKIKELQAMIQRARSLESELEFEQALALYDKVLAQAPNIAQDLQERVTKLRRDWAVRSDEHQAARDFIYQTWPRQTDAARIKEYLPKAWEAFKVCCEAGDLLSPQKLLRTSKELAAKLRKEFDGLRPEASDDDKRAAETIEEVSAKLAKLILDLSKVVEKAATP